MVNIKKKKKKRRRGFKLRHPFLIRLFGLGAAWLIRTWTSTLNYRLANLDSVPHPANAREQRFIYALWHEAILFLPKFREKVHILISQHPDGEFITRVCQHLGANVVRGSTTRGGAQALLEMLDRGQRTHLLVTPDGPQGPRRQVQLGLIFLASKTGLPIVPCAVGCSAAWRARSWDKMILPHPCSSAKAVIAPAIHVPPNLNRQQMEAYRVLVEQAMIAGTEAAERWANGGKLDTSAVPRAMPHERAA